MELTTLWFGLIAFFWTAYFVLEGFDFGVGMLSALLGRDERERGALLSTIGPVWDGNEVWLVVAGGAMFAAFPGWYAELTSSNYLALLAILVALIVRGVALEYRGKRDEPHWRRNCDLAVAVSSAVPPFLWGLVLSGSVLVGLVLLAFCLLHGWTFLRLRTGGPLRERLGRRGAEGPAFAATTVAIAAFTAGLFAVLYDPEFVEQLASPAYGLRVLSWAALFCVPMVIAYQGWSYWVFRKRVHA
ncbi:cytochrome d ubiquinol oxidase subunit II [Flindersiella endophytica]